jgi:hypothetical protein
MRSVEHWRMRKHRLCLEGVEITTPEGKKLCSITGNAWHESPSNGQHKERILPENTIIYEASELFSKNGRSGNGREPIKISGTTKIPVEISV